MKNIFRNFFIKRETKKALLTPVKHPWQMNFDERLNVLDNESLVVLDLHSDVINFENINEFRNNPDAQLWLSEFISDLSFIRETAPESVWKPQENDIREILFIGQEILSRCQKF